jgi:sec-independent protein translocase protein TatC
MTTKSPSQDPLLAEQHEENHTRMSFGDHLNELRKCVVRSAFGLIIGVAISLVYINQIVAFITHPLYVVMKRHGIPLTFITNSVAEPVMTYISLAMQVGLIIASPWIIFQIWSFVAAGLYSKERNIVYRYVGPSALLFLAGVAFFYFVVLPITLDFFVRFTQNTAPGPSEATQLEQALIGQPDSERVKIDALPSGADLLLQDPARILRIPWVKSDPPPPAEDGFAYLIYNAAEQKIKAISRTSSVTLLVTREGSIFTNYPRLGDYLRFVMYSALIFGAAFELPMVILVLAQVDIVRTSTFRKIRKHAYFALAVLAALLSPGTDVLTMFLLLVPMILLYEVGIIAAAVVTRGREDTED